MNPLRASFLFVALAGCAHARGAEGESEQVPLSVSLAHGSRPEQETAQVLRSLRNEHDLRPYEHTTRILIDERAIPHSHPILTLHTRDRGRSELLLSTYLHEQVHWFVASRERSLVNALSAVETMFPDAPAERPEGAGSRDSTLLHIVVCHLEHQILIEVLGRPRADSIIRHWSTHHYRWVYRTVLKHEEALGKIVAANALRVGPANGRSEEH